MLLQKNLSILTVLSEYLKMKRAFFLGVIFIFVATEMPLRAIPMIEEHSFVTESARQNSDMRNEGESNQAVEENQSSSARGSGLLVQEEQPNADILSLDNKRKIQVNLITPSDFSQTDRTSLRREIEAFVSSLKRITNISEIKEKANELLRRWSPKGVIINKAFVDRANNFRTEAENITAHAKELEDHTTKALEEVREAECNHYAAFYYNHNFISAALKASQAWNQTGEMYKRIPDRLWGDDLQHTWADKASQADLSKEDIINRLCNKADKTSEGSSEIINAIKKSCNILNATQKYDEVAQLSEAYKKVITVEKAVALARSNIKEALETSASESPVVLSQLDPKLVLALELAIEATTTTVHHAEELHWEIIPVSETASESESEPRTTNESSALEAFLSHLTLDEQKQEETNCQFQQRAAAVTLYANKTLDTADAVFRVFTAGDVEFGDATDASNLSEACNALEREMIILNVVQEKTANSLDDNFLAEKQNFSISTVEHAIKQINLVAQRINNPEHYEWDAVIDEISNNLRTIKEEYERSLATRSEEI